jgi:predicted homoserine dehydrogenase-like protein
VIVECTGNPVAAVDHILEAFAQGKHVVNVTVEADAFCGPILARRAAQAGVVYSLAFGDQPALICDLVDWARTCGFPVVAAGRGHKWLPHFSESTPDTVWGNYGLTPEQAARGGLNPKMFNSFLDGSKPSIESTAVANATGLTVPSNGLLYPPASVEDIPFVTRPRSEGGVLERKGMVEVISSLEADGRKIPYDIRMGVWVTVEAETEYIRNCFEEYNAHTDPSGRYFTLYKRWHLIGLEVGVSVASVALRGEPTGVATCWNADVVATAKRDLAAGEMLDGEGGYTVWGKLLPAATSMKTGGLPLGLAHNVKLLRPVKKGQSLCWDDVAMDTTTHGSGQLTKLANQMIVGITIGAVAEALLLCEKGGAHMDKVKEAITGGFADSRILQLHGQRMIDRDFTPRGRMSVQLKDLRNVLATAEEIGFSAPITQRFEQLYAEAVDHGLADLDHSGLFVEIASRNGMQ